MSTLILGVQLQVTRWLSPSPALWPSRLLSADLREASLVPGLYFCLGSCSRSTSQLLSPGARGFVWAVMGVLLWTPLLMHFSTLIFEELKST